MFEGLPILSLITFIPLAVAVILMVVTKFAGADGRAQMEKNAPRVALAGSRGVFVLSRWAGVLITVWALMAYPFFSFC